MPERQPALCEVVLRCSLATQKVRQDGRHVREVRVPAVEAADVGPCDCDAVGVAGRA